MLGASVSILIDPPEKGLDEDLFTDYTTYAGQILIDDFHQQSVTRKSFIIPQPNKNLTMVMLIMLQGERLYGNDLEEKVKNVKEIGKDCSDIKEKVPAQRQNTKLDDEPVVIEEMIQVRKPAEHLRHFFDRWTRTTSEEYILDCISGYRIRFTQIPIQKMIPEDKILSLEERQKIQLEMNELLGREAIEKYECKKQFISPFFLVLKPNGSSCFIFD